MESYKLLRNTRLIIIFNIVSSPRHAWYIRKDTIFQKKKKEKKYRHNFLNLFIVVLFEKSEASIA